MLHPRSQLSACCFQFLVALLLLTSTTRSADWPTARANPQRTGAADAQPGPTSPAIAWVYRSQEHFIASPVPGPDTLYVSALGAFATPSFYALASDASPHQRIRWTKSAPFLTRPTVSAPALVGNKIYFGDGMHQTDGAALFCLQADTGRPVWQYPLDGKLTHIEATPTVAEGRVYFGGGDAGVLCLDTNRVTLDGRELDITATQVAIDTRWQELLNQYEIDKKKDPDFAKPPSDDALPKPVPKFLWQKGRSQWHVDAPVALAPGRLLVASAYLDTEKIGRRALLCLHPADGTLLWEAPLAYNPWGGPTIAGDLVLVGGSSIRYDASQIATARGQVAAFRLADGKPVWHQELPGGVLAAVSVQGDLALAAATDGKLRALALADGQIRWTYDAHAPFFAGPAVDGKTAYAADLNTVLHAVALADGKPRWTLDLAHEPATRLPGLVFGAPLLAAGRLYLATCNVEGSHAEQPTFVVCIEDKTAATRPAAPGLVIDRVRRTITIPCTIAPRKLPELAQIYPIEVIATLPAPRGKKAHETVVTFDISPSEVHRAVESFGLKPGHPISGEGTPTGPEVRIFLELPGFGDTPRLVPIEQTLLESRTLKTMPRISWHFTGSVLTKPDPQKPEIVYGADFGGTLVTLFPVTDETVFQSSLTSKELALVKLETRKCLLPPEGASVRMIIQIP